MLNNRVQIMEHDRTISCFTEASDESGAFLLLLLLAIDGLARLSFASVFTLLADEPPAAEKNF